ncbi:hypothetical protein BDV96DRAFT_671566 [Lophiotrema nucula]|uniref:Uncharacterized protein n=1 Tax=Lophiotrema nucula TaxID=690887 RepID=A0A6A5ZM82_9PLEO|nr:hypothetical protein BDV96DRAFT_671566 [Lophiotrema nucula]
MHGTFSPSPQQASSMTITIGSTPRIRSDRESTPHSFKNSFEGLDPERDGSSCRTIPARRIVRPRWAPKHLSDEWISATAEAKTSGTSMILMEVSGISHLNLLSRKPSLNVVEAVHDDQSLLSGREVDVVRKRTLIPQQAHETQMKKRSLLGPRVSLSYTFPQASASEDTPASSQAPNRKVGDITAMLLRKGPPENT